MIITDGLGQTVQVELFYCSQCNKIVRGKVSPSPTITNPDDSRTIRASCPFCESGLIKTVHKRSKPETLPIITTDSNFNPRKKDIAGTIEKPSKYFWAKFARELELEQSVLHSEADEQAGIIWHTLTNDQKAILLATYNATARVHVLTDPHPTGNDVQYDAMEKGWHFINSPSFEHPYHPKTRDNPEPTHVPDLDAIRSTQTEFRVLINRLSIEDKSLAPYISNLDVAEMLGDETYHRYLSLLGIKEA